MSVVQLRPDTPVLLTKKQLASALDRSERWVEQQQQRGMPVRPGVDRMGRRLYDLEACRGWVQAGEKQPRPDRTALLEARVAVLEATVRRLERSGT